MPGRRWLIVADDRTGAADCAAAFAGGGLATEVAWDDGGTVAACIPLSCHPGAGRDPGFWSGTKGRTWVPASAGLPTRGAESRLDSTEMPASAVLAFDTASRGLSAVDTAAHHGAVLAQLLQPTDILYAKIDSTLRGQPAAAVAAALDATRARCGTVFGICAPAFPAAGRTTLGGCMQLDGQRLEAAGIWRRDHTYDTADVAAVLATAGVAAERIPLARIRGGADGLRSTFAAVAAAGQVVVCDAALPADLDAIAAASLPATTGTVFIGSAGLAHALAATIPRAPADPIRLPPARGGTLVVVGSLAGPSRAAARTLAREPGVRHVPVDPAGVGGAASSAGDTFLEDVVAGLRAGDDVLVELVSADIGGPVDPHFAAGLAQRLAPAAPDIGALAATGGETAAALLAAFGVRGMRLVGEVEPGVPLGLTRGGLAVPIVTKAGGFGDAGSLVRIVARLRHIGREGVLA